LSATIALVRKDWREALRGGWLPWAAAIIALLSLAAGLSAAVSRTETQLATDAALALDAETWLGQGRRNPHAAAHFARFAVRPAAPLEDIDPGVRAFMGSHVWMEAHLQRPAEARPAEDRAQLAPVGLPTPAWIVAHLGSLVALLCGAVSFAREREAGRVALLLASGARPAALALGKTVATQSIVLAIGSLVVGLSCLTVGWQILGGQGVLPDAGIRLLCWGFAALAFMAIWAGLGVAISFVASGVSSALLGALVLWSILVLAVPRAAVLVAATSVPAPDPATFMAQLQAEVREAIESDARASKHADLVARLRGDATAGEGRGSRLQRGEAIGNAVYDRRYAELDAIDRQRDDVRAGFALLSPLPAFQSLSATLTGTDTAHQADFRRQAEAARRDLVGRLNADQAVNGGDLGSAYEAGPELWARLPEFVYAPPSLAMIESTAARDATALTLWFLIALILPPATAAAALRQR
jgi:ABC-2 type transport system permease protein